MELKDEVLKLNINLSDDDINRFNAYYDFLVSYNEKVNLTAITDYEGVLIKHFYDSLNKRIVFLNELVKKLGISNVTPIHGRAEEYAAEKRETFDVVTARAVARLNILIELCIPFVKKGGLFIAMKSKEAFDELNEAMAGIKLLGGEVVSKLDFTLPHDMGERELIVIKKVKDTPMKYPRKFSIIKNKPLR